MKQAFRRHSMIRGPFRRATMLMFALVSLLFFNGCYFFGTVTEEASLLVPLLDGQSFSGKEIVLQQGQAVALEFVVSKNGKPKNWKVKGESLNPDFAEVYATQERNQFVITGIRPGKAELRFRVSDKRWYTRRKVMLQVTIKTSHEDSHPDIEAAGGHGGAN